MKKQILSFFAVLAFLSIYAQEDMTMVWETKSPHKITFNGTGTEERGYSYVASDKEFSLFDNATGKIKWTKVYKEIAPKLSKIDELIPFWESNTVFLFDRKMGKDQIACVDMETGSLLWNTDKYQNVGEENVVYIPEREGFAISLKDKLVFIKVATGEELWSTAKFGGVVGKYVFTPDGFLTTVNFQPSGLIALFTGFKNQIAKINMDNGDVVWSNTYIGRAERKIISREFLYDIAVEGPRVILRLNGIQVYDYNTGANLWSAAFDFTPNGVRSRPPNARQWGVYGAVADPVFDKENNVIYVLDMSNRNNQFVKKYDANTGKLIWTSPEIKGAKAIPGMYVVDDKVILQIGGIVEFQSYEVIQTQYSTITIWRVFYDNVKPNGLQAFNTKDGSLAWESEKFKKGITNAYVLENKILCSSGKELYKIDYKTGNEEYSVPVTDGGVGLAVKILPYKDKMIVVGEKGISAYNPVDGKFIYSGKYKASSLEDVFDNILIMKTEKADIASFNLDTGVFKEFKAKTGASTTLTTDGKFVYIYEDKVFTKVKTL
ncbi:MAG TPA: PQQ-binding-like beta-propeller repeat protein [Bacteroidales bacterium]|nr:PQQ-binding-like beta-propeller repeat protein [Bacteroidales bacterium]HPM91485.1 PQQ-binding-like beta-propeller repeat protein [Bacteroidales bacterium]